MELQTQVIKWGKNIIEIGIYNGEIWNHCLFEDVDRDKDINIFENCKEFHTLGLIFT